MKLLLTNGIACLFFLAFSVQLSAQSWTTKTNENGNPANFFDIQASFNAEWKDKEIVRSSGFKPYKRWEHYWETRVMEDGSFPEAGLTKREWEAYKRSHPTGAESSTSNWTSLGPNSNTSGYAGTGRINAIGFHPTDMNTFYVGAPVGGIWKTTNGGTSWTPLADGFSSMGVSAIIVHPTSPNTIYIATGDGDGSDSYSTGVLKSTDGGATWNTTGLNWNTFSGYLIYKMVMDPSDPNTLLVASSLGIYRTTNGGTTWTREISGLFYDVAAKPGSSSDTFYGIRRSGSTCYVHRSTDNGDTWTQTYTIASCNRASLAVTAAAPSYVYILASKSSGSSFLGYYRSTDSGANFTQQSNSPNIMGYSATGSDTRGQGWYDLVTTADPLNQDVVYVGGINCWKSTDGGVTWSLNSHWSSSQGGSVDIVHADKHALFWQNNTTLFEGNDGGVYRTTDGGNNWTDVTNNLVISQMYKIGVAQTDASLIAGLQDNGTKLRNAAGNWSDEVGGDGMECAINPNNSNVMYAELYYGDLRRNTNGGSGFWTDIQNNIPGNPSGAWVTPFALDPNTPTTIYAGYQDLFKSTDQGNSWTSIASTTTSDLRHVVVAPSNSNYIYIGTNYSFWRTTDGGATWNGISAPSSGVTTYLAVSPTDPNTLYATRGNFTDGEKVYKSTNGGTSWTNISGSLPNIPANCIVYQNNSSEGLYVGMDVGVYYRDTSMSDWTLYSTNLPNTQIRELEINYSTFKLVAATYGRGIWESDIVPADPCSGSPNAGTVTGPASSPCPGEDFILTLSGQSVGPDFTVQWEDSPNGTAWSSISGATSTSYTTNVTNVAYFRAKITCTTSGNSSFSNSVMVSAGANPCLCSCASNATSTLDTRIDTVWFNGTAFGSDPSTCATFTDYGNTNLTFAPGETVNMTVKNGTCNNYYAAHCTVYADWNGDNDFDDTDETIFSAAASGVNTLAPFTMTVPAGQADGSVKVRVVLREGSSAPACGTFTYGETADFCVEVEDVGCTTALTNLTAKVNLGTLVTVGWDQEPSATYSQQIKYREVGTTPWLSKNVGPAPTNAYLLRNLSPNTSYQYRSRIICGPGNNGPWTPTQTFTTYDSDPCSSPDGNFVMYHRFWDYSRVRLVANWEPDADDNGRIQVRWKEVSASAWEQRNLYGRSFVNAKNLMPNTDYEVQWRARCNNAWTAWSVSNVFTTLTAAPLPPQQPTPEELAELFEGEGAQLDAQVFPNPVSDVLSIVSKDQSQRNVRIYDMRGKLLMDRQIQSQFNQIDMGSFQSGTYIIQIIGASGAVLTEKVSKL